MKREEHLLARGRVAMRKARVAERKPWHVAECQQMLSCVCLVVRSHPDHACRLRVSILCPVAVQCDHGFDVCPKCDPCTCLIEKQEKGRRKR